MYCGKNRTACTSQRQISDAMLRLMHQKPYSSISVSALCKEAGISRQTFYSLFSSMENVILYILQEDSCHLPQEQTCKSSLDFLCGSYSAYISHHRDFLKLLVENHIGYLLYNSIFDSFNHCCCFRNTNEEDRLYAAHFLAGGITGVVRQYCLTEPPQAADLLREQLKKLFSGKMFEGIS